MNSSPLASGFSTVELLITIFVGAVFIFTGYQLYGIVTKSNQEISDQSIASSAARSELQRVVHNNSLYTATCTELETAAPLSYNVQFDKYPTEATLSFSCPAAAALSSPRKATVTATYKGATATHALFYTQQ